MKRNPKRMALIVLLIMVLIPVLLWMANLAKAARLDKEYTDLDGIAKSGQYLVSELVIPGQRLLYQSADRNGADLKKVTDSYLRYDPVNRLIIIGSEEPAPGKEDGPNSDQLAHLSFFDLTWKKIRQSSRLYRLDQTGL
ncbi:hypothetical protein ACS5PU_02290 [Pedobacter sp. GSP4]|uniref:hypothetical protein n=1 Tax=Pedobacter sp. GSP4 TaxID=3453716 RepID=UPI003EEA4A1B